MAAITVLGQDKQISQRVGELEQIKLILRGQLADLEDQAGEVKANLCRVEGGISELGRLLTPSQVESMPSEPEG